MIENNSSFEETKRQKEEWGERFEMEASPNNNGKSKQNQNKK